MTKMDEPAAASQRTAVEGNGGFLSHEGLGFNVTVRRLVRLIGTLRSRICGPRYSRLHNLALRVQYNLRPKEWRLDDCKSIVSDCIKG